MTKAKCPSCGSQDIRERNTASADLPVTVWGIDDDGALCPISYETDVSIDWECSEEARPYVCAACHEMWSVEHLVAEEG